RGRAPEPQFAAPPVATRNGLARPLRIGAPTAFVLTNVFSPENSGRTKLLSTVSREGLSRFVNFAHDLRNAITQFATNCSENGYIVLTLGNRNICGTVCPLNEICAEILSAHNAREVLRITRQIPSKRMPGKNGHSFTINHEYITVFHTTPRIANTPAR
ncbi:MAG: hypothetical protein P4L50_13480, partial [Anaerolineaceae bacterium]|nr:hypothetical protein [Anaerolineaceae bacterium]